MHSMHKINMEEKTKQQEQQSGPRIGQKQKGEDRRPREIGGPKGPEPTRYGDWERRGRCIDF